MLKPPPPPRVFGLDKVVTRQFVCDGAEISILKAKSSPGSCDVGVKPKPSRVEVVTTIIWKALIRVSEAKYGRLRTSLAVHCMNLRAKIVPALQHIVDTSTDWLQQDLWGTGAKWSCLIWWFY